ncbi:hypothetical protein IAR50_000246 [Cryptococcus sp. DSM 104548]
MLLRLLPCPTLDTPSPLTILFTLPLPTHPYTSRSLPLPSALLSHRNLCVQEAIPCPNILLGECATWVSAIIDDVTFSLPLRTVAINFIDGTSMTMPVTDDCARRLDTVVEQVQLSFAASPRPESAAGPSSAPAHDESGSRRSFLYNILSPLLPSSPQMPPQPARTAPVSSASARVHRRLARSILVDTYRCHVLSVLKDNLPSAYLPWSIQSECARLAAEFEKLKAEIDGMLEGAHVCEREREMAAPSTGLTRSRSTSSSSDHASSSSNSDSVSTEATSIASTTSCPASTPRTTPQSYLLSLPASHTLPLSLRTPYTHLLSRLTKIASRTSQLRKLGMRYDREDGKRSWLENLERGRLADRAVRRSWGNLELPLAMRKNYTSMPQRGSRLWRSVTAEDLERERQEREARAMLMVDTPYADVFGEEEEDSDAASFTSDDEDLPVTPTSKPSFPMIRPVLPGHVEQCEPQLYVSVEDVPSEPETPVKRHHHSPCPPPPLVHSSPNSQVVSSFHGYRASWEDVPVVGKVTSAMESLLLAGPLIKARLAVAEDVEGNGEVQMERFYGQCGLHV